MYRLFKYVSGNKRYLDIEQTGGLVLVSNDPLNYDFAKSSKTYTIKLHNTPNNNNQLNMLFEARMNFVIEHDVFLEFNNVVFPGILYVRNFNDETAEAQFVSDFSVILEDVGRKKLKELDWSEYDISSLSTFIITNSWNQDQFGGDIVFDFLDRGDGYNMRVGTRRYLKEWHLGEVFPSIRFKAVLEKALAGYTINYDIGDIDRFSDVYLIFSQDRNRNTDNWAGAYTEAAVVDESTITLQQVLLSIDNEKEFEFKFGDFRNYKASLFGYDSITDVFTIAETGIYNVLTQFKGNIEIKPDVNTFIKNVKLELVLQQNGQDYKKRTIYENPMSGANTSFLIPWNDIQTSDISLLETTMGEQTEGTTFRAYLQVTFTAERFESTTNTTITVDCNRENADVLGNVTQLRVDTWEGYGHRSNIPGSFAVPDMRTSELIQEFLRIYNAEMYISMLDKKIYFQNRQQAANIQTFDITNNVIEGSFKSIIGEEKSSFILRYARDSADAAQELQYPSNVGGVEIDFQRVNTKILESKFSLSAVGGRRELTNNILVIREASGGTSAPAATTGGTAPPLPPEPTFWETDSDADFIVSKNSKKLRSIGHGGTGDRVLEADSEGRFKAEKTLIEQKVTILATSDVVTEIWENFVFESQGANKVEALPGQFGYYENFKYTCVALDLGTDNSIFIRELLVKDSIPFHIEKGTLITHLQNDANWINDIWQGDIEPSGEFNQTDLGLTDIEYNIYLNSLGYQTAGNDFVFLRTPKTITNDSHYRRIKHTTI